MRTSVMEIRDRIRRGEMSALEAVDEALRQLDVVNPRLQAALQIFPDGARTAAAAIDRRLAAGEDAGPLAGVPFTVKDNFCTLEGHTTAGSRILESFASPYDATAVRKLKEAGAVCVAKTNLDEFGMGSSTENSAFHVTRNPWKTTHVPGGSSGGAAALAVSTGGIIHLGSDTGGSIRQPSACCGASGLKPTYGRVSRYGLVAFASSLDQIGPIQSSALDCALVLETIAGADPMDSTSRDLPVPRYADEAQQDIRGLRLGVPAEYFPEGIEAEVEEKVRAAIEVFREMGAEVRDVSLPHTRYANPAYVLVSAAEASSNLARYDGVHYGRRSVSASGLVDMYCRSRGEGFGAEVKRRILIGTFVLSSGYYDAYYLTALRVRNLIRQDFEKVYREVDAVVCPTSPVPAFPLGDRIDDPLKLYAVDVLTVPANLASLPGMSIPCGFTSEALPVGLQIYGRPMQDEIVLRLACAYQARTDHHLRAPPVCGWRGGEEGG